MTDRVYPSSKATANGGGAVNSAVATTAATNPAGTKPQLRQPYRPQPQYRHRRHRRSNRNLCCCCCFWSILVILALGLLCAIAGAAVYILYHPHRPEFTVSSLHIGKLNLTTNADATSSHLVSLFNLTVSTRNPNEHLTFAYEPFALLLSSSAVPIGNGSIPKFTSGTNNSTTFRAVLAAAQDVDVESVKPLRSDLKKKSELAIELQMDTKVLVKMGKLKSKKVGIRVTCQGIKGVVPKGKSPSVASVSKAKCKVDLRIKIWKWTF